MPETPIYGLMLNHTEEQEATYNLFVVLLTCDVTDQLNGLYTFPQHPIGDTPDFCEMNCRT
jgi:hypothetical protein